MGTKLYVGGLPYSVTEQQLNELFAQQGTVSSAKVITDKFTGQSRGFGFVEMSTDEEAKKAISALNGTQMDGRPLTVNEVVQKSSNVGTVKMAMQMQPREMHELFAQLGFGQKPQINFPGAVSGRLRPYKTWRPIEQATMSYGYGLSASLFQIARAYTVFAHDGELLPSSLTKVDAAPAGMRVMSAQTAKDVLNMLNMVTLEGGTAPKAQAMGYSVGGKTGTAYKQEGKGYNDKKYRAWFVGIAPIHNPRIVVAVMVDEPTAGKYYGGDVAAPVFSEVVQQTLRTLGVQPDLDVRQQIVTQKLPAEVESF